MTTQTNSKVQDAKAITLAIHQSAELELAKAKGALKKSPQGGTGWLAHLSAILEVFEAIDNSNTLMTAEHNQLDKANYMKETLYGAIRNCTSLDQLMDYFKNLKNQIGPEAAQDPALASFVTQLGAVIYSDEQNFLKGNGDNKKDPAYQNWKENELPIFTNMVKGFDLEGTQKTDADTTFAKNADSDRTTLVSAMQTLSEMSVQSTTNPN